MKRNEWQKYLTYIVLILVIVFGGQHIYDQLIETGKRTCSSNIFLIGTVMLLIFTAIGAVLGLDHFRAERKKGGKWRVNLPKIVLLGVPSLYFSLSIFLYFSSPAAKLASKYPGLLAPIRELLFTEDNLINGFQVVLGYAIITSFYKYNGCKE